MDREASVPLRDSFTSLTCHKRFGRGDQPHLHPLNRFTCAQIECLCGGMWWKENYVGFIFSKHRKDLEVEFACLPTSMQPPERH